MKFSTIFTIATLTLSVSALPGGENRNQPSCYGGQVYNDAHKSCLCPPSQSWSSSKNKCCYAAIPTPQCPKGQDAWCSSSSNEYCKYDANQDYCQNNGYNSAWCAADNQAPSHVSGLYPPKPNCKGGQQWCATTKACQCPSPMTWKDEDQSCHYPPMPKPACGWGMQAYCGKSRSKSCAYDENNDYCSNDGAGYTWCSLPSLFEGLIGEIFDLI